MEDFGTLFSEEDIKIIGNIFQIELEKHERKRAKLVSASLKITMDEIKITQDEKKLEEEVTDLNESLEFTGNILEEKVKNLMKSV